MLLLFIIVWPLLLAASLPFIRRPGRWVRSLGWLGALPAAGIAWSGLTLPETEIPILLLGSVLTLGPLQVVFLALAGTLWAVAGWYGQSYLGDDPRVGRFQAFFLLSMAGNFGLIVAADLITFYGCFVLMTFASYGLVVHQNTTEAHRAGRIYLIMSLIGEVLLLSALFLAVDAAGSIRLDALAPAMAEAPNQALIGTLAFLGFGVKAGAIPLYFWLPLAHPVAPTPASAVLSGSMIKAGLLGWLYLLPVGAAALPIGGQILIILGFLAAFGAALLGLGQTVPKTLLAYSSISQMGLMTVLLGLGLMQPGYWPVIGPAIALYALHHGLAKGALFLGVGVLPVCPPKWRRLFWAGLALPALAIAGAPLTSGALAKYGLKEAANQTEILNGSVLIFLLSLSAVTTSLLLGKFFWRLKQTTNAPGHGSFAGVAVPFFVLLLFVAVAPFVAVGYFRLPVLLPSISVGTMVEALWPILMGGLLVFVGLRYLPRRWQRIEIPAGDGVVLVEWMIVWLRRKITWSWGHQWDQEFLNVSKLSDRIIDFEHTQSIVNRAEARLGSWNLFGFLLIALLLGFIVVLTAF